MTEGMLAKESKPERISVHTLGCKLNYSESSSIAGDFARKGYRLVPFGEETDIFVLNTCSVTENAEKECRQLIRRTLRHSPSAKVIVTGCYAQLRPNEIANIEGVSAVFGAKEKFDFLDYLHQLDARQPLVVTSEIGDVHEFHGATSFEGGDRTRAFLKVQDGCDYTCSYCTIPEARGISRSGSIEGLVRRAKELCEEGFQEIVLSGVNVGDFGRQDNFSLYDLVLALENDLDVTARIRISSIEPNLLTDGIIELTANSKKFCPHFHIPMQSGSGRILRLMQRRYQPTLYRTRIETIKALMPNACIGADVIVGFPGETEADFQETVDFIESLELSYLHVFTYSERPGTKAILMPGTVPMALRRERNQILRLISDRKRRAFHASQISRELTVLLEHNSGNGREGYSENYVRTKIADTIPHNAELVQARIIGIEGETAVGELVEVLTVRHSLQLPIL